MTGCDEMVLQQFWIVWNMYDKCLAYLNQLALWCLCTGTPNTHNDGQQDRQQLSLLFQMNECEHKHWTHRTQHVKWTKIICIVTDVCLVWHIHPTLNHSLNNHLMMYVQCTQWTVLKYSIFPKIRNRTEYKIGYLLKVQLFSTMENQDQNVYVCVQFTMHI